MYMKVFPHGQGNGKSPTHYLVRMDYPNREENPPVVLRGNVEETQRLIDSLETKWKFTAGVLSWHPEDTVSPEKEQEVMDSFEQLAFAGLEQDQRNILWVRHSHANHHELHFVIPRVELYGGKAYNPCPPGWQKSFDVFRDLFNLKEDWARPDDPKRARLYVPEQADLKRARLIRWGKNPPNKQEREQAKEAIHNYLLTSIEQGKIRNKADIVKSLQDLGLQINRQGKDYLTVIEPESKEKLRLKGAIYAEQFDITDRENQSQDRTGTVGNGNDNQAEFSRLAGEFEQIIQKRADYNRKRYSQQPLTLGKHYQNGLSEHSKSLEQSISQSPVMEHNNHSDDRHGIGGNFLHDTLSNQSLESRDCRVERTEGTGGSRIHQGMESLQRLGVLPTQGGNIFDNASRLANQVLRNNIPDPKGQTERLGDKQIIQNVSKSFITIQEDDTVDIYEKLIGHKPNQTINNKDTPHDRIGTHTQANTSFIAAGHPAKTDKSGNTPEPTGTNHTKPEQSDKHVDSPKHGFSINLDPIRRNLAILEQCIQQLESLASILAITPKKLTKDRGIGR